MSHTVVTHDQVPPYDGGMDTTSDTTDTLGAPIITVEATPRHVQLISLGGQIYRVRRPKSVIQDEPKAAMMKVGIALKKILDNSETTDMTQEDMKGLLTEDEYVQGTRAIWDYFRLVLVDDADYRAVRRRIYGDVGDDLAGSNHFLTIEEIRADNVPAASINRDDLEPPEIIKVVTQLIDYWFGDDTVKTQENPPQKPTKSSTPGKTVVKKAARQKRR